MIWRRYLLSRLVKSFSFILCSIFSLFVFIDLATRGGKILGKQFLPSYETLFYYVYQFSNYLHFFFPLSFLLASIHVLLDLNAHYELVALQMGGLSRRRLLSPFFALAFCLSLGLLANYEWMAPEALASAYKYQKAYARHKKKSSHEHLYDITLDDGAKLIFQAIDEEKKELFDVYWLTDHNAIWYMKYLQLQPSVGRCVERFEKLESQWRKTGRFETLEFPQISIDEKKALQPFIFYDRRPLSELVKGAFVSFRERPKILSHLFYKLSTPLLLFLSILAIAPLCFAFSRQKRGFAILACSLFGFLSIIMLLDGLLVLGENQVIPAPIAFGVPLAVLLGCCYRPFKRLSE